MNVKHASLVVGAAAALSSLAVADAPPQRPPFAPSAARGGLVYVSGILPPSPPSAQFAGQASAVLEALRSTLATPAPGVGLDRVVSVSVYLADAADFGELNAVWRRFWPTSPPARTTVVAQLPMPGARIMVSAVAAEAATERAVVLPEGWQPPASPYSYGVRTGDILFLSGLVARRGADGVVVTGGIELQVNAVFENADAILKAAGFGLRDVVSARVFLTDGSTFDRMNAVYRPRFATDPPARATVITPLTSPDYLIEITMVAVRGAARTAVLAPNADGSPGRANPNLSAAIRIGPRLFLSGMLGAAPGNAADAAAQATETLNRLERTMASAGFAWRDVAESIVYVTDMSAAPAVLEVLAARAGGRLPAGTLVGTGLVSPEGRVEVMLNASK